jgi:drug/metabolite transporter (DMT)-like permease
MGDDWAVQTADTIERYVGTVRSKTTEPVERVARILVYGLVATILGIAALALLMILVIRVLDIAIPGEVWSAYFVAGGIFTIAGLLLWSKRSVPDARTSKKK